MRKMITVPAMLLVLAAGLVHADTLLNTYSSWNGVESFSAFGNQGDATYGQTFTVLTSDTTLANFSFWLQPVGSDPVAFTAYVAQWDAADGMATGPMLYTSSPQTLPGDSTSFTEFDFNTGGVSLVEGEQYVAFLNASAEWGQTGYGDSSMAAMLSGATGHDSSTSHFVYDSNEADFSALTTSQWNGSDTFAGSDAAFKADLTAGAGPGSTPELPAAPLALLGMACVGLARSRRRAKA
jgi:hypothetical protein